MTKKVRYSILTILLITIFGLMFIFTIGESYHNFAVHLIYLFVVIGVLWLEKHAFYPLSLLIVGHLTIDTIVFGSFPMETFIDSLSQILVALGLYYLVTVREKKGKEYQEIIEATHVGTWQWNLITNKTKINDMWADMLGYKREELEPTSIKTWESLVHPDDLKKSNEEIQKVLDKKKDFYQIQVRLQHKKGYYIWVEDHGKITKRTIDGKPLVMSGMHTDITAQKNLDNKERYYQNLLDYIIDHMNAGIAVHDKDLNYVYVSEKYLEQYNVQEKDVIGKHHYDVFPDLPQKWRDVHQRSLKGEICSNDRDPFIHEDGSVDWTRWTSRPWYDEAGDIAGIIIYTEVINDFIEREQELETMNETLFIQKEETEATLLAIGDAVISTDETGHINAFNTIAEELTEYPKAEVIGKPFNDVFHIVQEGTKKKLKSPVDYVLEHQKTMHLENHTSLITKSGQQRIIEDSAAPIFNNDGKLMGVILVFRDVTERKQKQKEIEYLSLHDYLTGLYNRRFFSSELARIDQESHYPVGLMMIDVNGLKIMNDAYGHETGDKALKAIAEILLNVIQDRGTVARIGGDEFTVLISNTSDTEMHQLEERIKENVHNVKIKQIPLSIAIGYTVRKNNKKGISNTLKNAEDMMYRLKLVEGVSARNNTIQAILNTLTDKFDIERRHSERVSKICYEIGKALELRPDELTELKLSGMFHDIGKISIPDYLLKKPEKLTSKEFNILKEHTTNGYKILRAADEYSHFAEHALYHHEHYNGNGYPDGLKGENIPLIARIISVADAYEAMTSDRPYRKAMTKEYAINELITYKGTQFDPKIVDTFVNQVFLQEDL